MTRSTIKRNLGTLRQAEAHSGLSQSTLRRYIAQGRLTGYRIGPRLIKVDLDELEALAYPIPAASR